MAQHPFLFKWPNDKRIMQGMITLVERPEIMKEGKVEKIGGIPFRFMERTGRLANDELQVHIPHKRFTMKATREGVREQVRRLRAQEAAELDEVDRLIAEAMLELKRLERVRSDFLKVAWSKANVVTVQELVDRIQPKGGSRE